MGMSKEKSAGLVVGCVALLTSGYLAFKRYREYKKLQCDLDTIPWDVPEEYTSWKTIFNTNPKINT